MKTYIFHGLSLNVFGEYNQTGIEKSGDASRRHKFIIKTPDGAGVVIVGEMSPTSSWLIGVAPLNNNRSLADWKITVNPGRGVCNELKVIAPDDACLIGRDTEEKEAGCSKGVGGRE